MDEALLRRAREIELRFKISWWDSMIVAAAQLQDCVLLLTEDLQDGAAYGSVTARSPFTLQVSTRNLVRDRFLAAGQGGYYVESSVLTGEGLVRGHFHTACRMLSSTSEAHLCRRASPPRSPCCRRARRSRCRRR